MIRFRYGLVTAGLLLVLVSVAEADIIFTADLSGLQEVPPVDTPAKGFGFVTLNAAEDEININLSFQDLLASQIAAHIHGPAPIGVNAGVLIPLPLGQIASLVLPVSPAQAGFIKDGLTYFNVHSALFPGGEIRGQIIEQAVPEPSTLVLWSLGAVALVGLTLRRRKRAA